MRVFKSSNPDYPVVKLTSAAEAAVGGNVSVDLDMWHALLSRFGVATNGHRRHNFTLFGRFIKTFPGFYNTLSGGSYVQLPTSAHISVVAGRTAEEGAVRSIMHRASHVADWAAHPLRSGAETLGSFAACSAGLIGGGLAASEFLPPAVQLPATVAAGSLAVSAYRITVHPGETRAYTRMDDQAAVDTFVMAGLIKLPNYPYKDAR